MGGSGVAPCLQKTADSVVNMTDTSTLNLLGRTLS